MEQDRIEQIKELQKQIEQLPKGCISRKRIGGKVYSYHQWTEEGKRKSKYLNDEEALRLSEQIEQRKSIQSRLDELLGKKTTTKSQRKKLPEFETNIRTGKELASMVESVDGLQKRDMYSGLVQYLHGKPTPRVYAVYGLRRTGKTTMLFQAINEMTAEEQEKAVYVKLRINNTMENILHDLDKLYKAGYRYIFMDEVTLMEDFIDTASMFSDIYAPMGMRIVLSGTDSLGFWLAAGDELYDRVTLAHTTYIPYREYSRLLGIDSIDEYIRYGGTLKKGETDFDDDDLTSDEASFRDDESTRRYIDTAISKNIQRSLAYCKRGNYFRHLYELYEAGELTGAINRIIEDMNHRFVLSVLTKEFTSGDLSISANNLRKERDAEKRTDILYRIDRKAVTDRLMKILDIRNAEEQKVGITKEHIAEIKQYLKALDLIMDSPVEMGEAGLKPEEHVLFTQPGMRYCQAQALVHSLLKDETFLALEAEKRAMVCERILEEVRGRMLEDIILLETSRSLGKNYEVFKLRFERGEFDMVIYNKAENECAIYEVKHSRERVSEQSRHLRNEEMLAKTTPRYGTLAGRYVLYLGEDADTEDGIAYRNAERFLKNLPNIELSCGLEKDLREEEGQGFRPTM